MKKILAGVVIGMASSAQAWDPTGTWVNLDSGSGGIHHLVISGNAIHGFGQCQPTPCDWGTTPLLKLVATHDRANEDRVEFLALWDFGFKFTALMISPHSENPNYIVVKSYDLYSLKGDLRQNRWTVEYLKRSAP